MKASPRKGAATPARSFPVSAASVRRSRAARSASCRAALHLKRRQPLEDESAVRPLRWFARASRRQHPRSRRWLESGRRPRHRRRLWSPQAKLRRARRRQPGWLPEGCHRCAERQIGVDAALMHYSVYREPSLVSETEPPIGHEHARNGSRKLAACGHAALLLYRVGAVARRHVSTRLSAARWSRSRRGIRNRSRTRCAPAAPICSATSGSSSSSTTRDTNCSVDSDR